MKKRRLERELERQEREESMLRVQREKEVEQFEVWARQEDQFHLEQARLRSRIRIADGRGNHHHHKHINKKKRIKLLPFLFCPSITPTPPTATFLKDKFRLCHQIKPYKSWIQKRLNALSFKIDWSITS